LKWLASYGPLRELDLGARREHCAWEVTDRMRKEGPSLMLPDIQGFRELARLLALRARQAIAEGHVDQAVYTLHADFAFAKHRTEAPNIFSSLVGTAVADLMIDEVEILLQTPGAPNLYWALTGLPRPFVEMRKPIQGEKLMLLSLLPSQAD